MATKLILESSGFALRKFAEVADDFSTTSAKKHHSTRTGLFMKLQIMLTIVQMDENLTAKDKAWILNDVRLERLSQLGKDIETKNLERFDRLKIRPRCIKLFEEIMPMYSTLRDSARLTTSRTRVACGSQRAYDEVADLDFRREILGKLPAAESLAFEPHGDESDDESEESEDNEDSVVDVEQHLRTLLADIKADPRLLDVDKELLLNAQTLEWQRHLEVRFSQYRVKTTTQQLVGTFDGLKWDYVTLTALLKLLYDRFCLQRKMSLEIQERIQRMDEEIQRRKQNQAPAPAGPAATLPFGAAGPAATLPFGAAGPAATLPLGAAEITAPVGESGCGGICVIS